MQREDKSVLHVMAGAVECSPWTLLPTPMPASDCHLPCRLQLSVLVSTVAIQVLLCLSHTRWFPPFLLDWFFPLSRAFYPHMVLFQQLVLKYHLLSLEDLGPQSPTLSLQTLSQATFHQKDPYFSFFLFSQYASQLELFLWGQSRLL